MLAWAAIVAALAPPVRLVGERLGASVSAGRESESDMVAHALTTRFAAASASQILLVIRGLPTPDHSDGEAVLRRVIGSVDSVPGVLRALSYLTATDSGFLAPDATFAVVEVAPKSGTAADLVSELRPVTQRYETELRPRHPRVELLWTGEPAFEHDIQETSSADAAAAERRIAPLTLVLLTLVFGGVVAALLPLAIGALAIVLTLGAAVLISYAYPLSTLLQNIVSMLGLGVGVDYALLAVTRFREGLARGTQSEEAAVETVRFAGHTILVSGASVLIGFAALLVVPASELRSVAVGGLLVISFAVLLATTLLPGILAWLGPRVDRLRVRRLATAERGEIGLARATQRWRWWGHAVASRPWRVLVAGAAPMLALSWQARRMDASRPNLEALSASMESTRGLQALRAMGKGGLVETIHVLVELPRGAGVLTDRGWQAVSRISQSLVADGRVASVQSLPSLTRARRPSASLLTIIPPQLWGQYISRDERAALIEVVPKDRTAPDRLMQLVRDIRHGDAGSVSGLPGTRLLVGGLPAGDVENQDAIGGNFAAVVSIVIGGTFLALMIGFRSLLVPLKAVALNLLSVGAAFGAAVLVFQDGHGIGLLGLSQPVVGFQPSVPVIVFCIVFGLSMDYEVFLVSRVAEAHRDGADPTTAVAEGVARTGGVITSAALVMIAVFAAFALGQFLIVKVLGFTLSAAVLLDATLVRMAIGPALLRLAGNWNWWPGERRAR